MDSDFMDNLKNMMNANSENGNNTNSINPDMLKNLIGMLNQSNTAGGSNNEGNFNDDTNSSNTDSFSSSSNSSASSDAPNIDINMLFKMKSIMDKMNSNKNDPRSKLLLSLKPYLKESRKNKLDTYIQLLNMGKIIEVFNQDGGESTK